MHTLKWRAINIPVCLVRQEVWVSLSQYHGFQLQYMITLILAWGEIWNSLGPLTARCFEGNAVAKKDDLFFFDKLTDKRLPEEVYHSWDWTPVAQEDGSIGGLLNSKPYALV